MRHSPTVPQKREQIRSGHQGQSSPGISRGICAHEGGSWPNQDPTPAAQTGQERHLGRCPADLSWHCEHPGLRGIAGWLACGNANEPAVL